MVRKDLISSGGSTYPAQTLIGDSDYLLCHHSKQLLRKQLGKLNDDLFHQMMTGCMFSSQVFSWSTKVLSRRALVNFIA